MRFGQRVPSIGIPQKIRGVVDLYDASTDWIPIYDKSQLPGFYMACGSNSNLYKNAPIAGKMMAALISYCENGADHDTDPLQFTLPYLQRDIDVGFALASVKSMRNPTPLLWDRYICQQNSNEVGMQQ